ncbi:hypothetical protein Mal4_20680 [Maioricimonas rarisocia]|uniref:Uncharacterized protein n=1 Tax=Maioricimonas rarisocia TaxID=2528026 RepID=A0A517Z5M6_9PLAN|nr:hypothetical protein [Maioricimonas rarisocia]QDU37751.1 hypothetical protein Mal4_20680 [Maioricimonas rarisocia]
MIQRACRWWHNQRSLNTAGRLSVAVLALLLVTTPVCAQSSESIPPDETEEFDPLADLKPVLVVNVGSADRVLSTIDFVLNSVDRPELYAALLGEPLSFFENLDWMHRDQPFGMMMFVKPALPPQPTPVFFVPVKDVRKLVALMSKGPLTAKKRGEAEGYYEFTGRRQSIYMSVANGYAYLSPDEELADLEHADPLEANATLTSRYDAALSIQLDNFPPIIREVFINYLRASAESELQQRDEESEAAYRIRRAYGISTLELLSQTLEHGERFVIGLDASAEKKSALLEMAIDARADSDFADYLDAVGTKPTRFGSLINDFQPLTASLSWAMDKRERTAATELVNGLELALAGQLPTEAGEGGSINRLCSVLRETVDEGHFDFCTQFVMDETGQFVLLGALRTKPSEDLSLPLRQVLTAVSSTTDIEADIEIDAAKYERTAIHRITPSDARDDDRRLYGRAPDILCAATPGIFWFAVGGDGAQTAMEFAMDLVAEAETAPVESRTPPFQMIFRVSPWLQLPPPPDNPPQVREIAGEAFDDRNDSLRIEVRPTETGLRLRAEFAEGFIRLIGTAIARRYDESQL